MVTTSKVVDGLLASAANSVYGDYQYFQVGTGTTPFVDGSDDLTSGVSFDGVNNRKVRDSSSTGSFISGREMIMLFILDPGEPVSQPVNLGELGLFKTNVSVSDMGVGAVFNVVQTKDNTVKHRYRMSLRFNRISEV